MDKRTFLALLLTANVIVGVPMLFRSTAPRRASLPVHDTAAIGATSAAGGVSKAPVVTAPAVADSLATARSVQRSPADTAPPTRLRAETTTVALGKARY